MDKNQPNNKFDVNRFSPSREISAAFEGDNFERIKLAERLANYIEKIKNGAVIAIDAPWGEGKTWFGLHFEKYLKDTKKHKTIFIDAFKQDYIEDPFLLISAEISSQMENKSQQAELQKEAVQIMKYLTQTGVKAVMSELASFLIEISGLSEAAERINKKIADKGVDDVEEWINKKFKNYEKEKASFINFKNKLEEFCTSPNQPPVIVFIDELDRCKPTFAVQLIERIKHLFDVQNLIFILLLNRKQLEKAIGGVYGLGTESTQYLGKFINLSFNLPTAISYQDYSKSSKVHAFIKQKLNEYNFAENMTAPVETFNKELVIWANAKSMSLRDIEQACTLFALSNLKPHDKTCLLTYFIAMKIMNPDIFKSLRSDNYRKRAINVESEAKQFLSDVISKLDSHAKKSIPIKEASAYLHTLRELHIAIDRGFGAINRDDSILSQRGVDFFGFNPIQYDDHYTRNYFNEVYNLIDFPVGFIMESE